MKTGDLVRFWHYKFNDEPHKPKILLGLLLNYKSWEKVATVLYKGETLKLRAEHVEKAGKKDFANR